MGSGGRSHGRCWYAVTVWCDSVLLGTSAGQSPVACAAAGLLASWGPRRRRASVIEHDPSGAALEPQRATPKRRRYSPGVSPITLTNTRRKEPGSV